MALDVDEDAVAKGACFLDVAGAKGEAKALGSGIRFVDGNMAPPHPPVVPEVMVLVLIVDTQSNSGFGCGWHVVSQCSWS